MRTSSTVSSGFPAGAMFVDGGLRGGGDGETFEHVNPSTGQAQWKGVLPGPSDLDEAVRSSRAAQAVWRSTDPAARGAMLESAAAALTAHADELATLAIAEAGVPASQARTMAAFRPAAVCRYYAGWADKIEGEIMPIFPNPGFDYTRLEPYGTIAVTVSWRNPLLVAATRVSAALAAGNCVILNPSPQAPFTSLRLAELFCDAGLPPGVLNVIPGGVAQSERLAGHRGVDKVSVTGSRPVARRVMQTAARQLVPVAIEAGGPAGHIVFADADLAVAAREIVAAAFVSPAGPGHAPPARLLASGAVADELAERVRAAATDLIVGDPADPTTDVGPLIDADTCRQTEGFVEEAARAGRLLAGGERLGGALAGGYFLRPALIGEPPSGAAAGEVDGPVLLLSRFGSDDEAVRLANQAPGGFRGGVYTTELGRTHRFAAALASGSITVNGSDAWSAAGEGRAGLVEFVRTKNVFVDLSA